MAAVLLCVILLVSIPSAIAGRRKRLHGVFYWRGVRNLFIAGLVFWATFTDGRYIRVVGLVVAVGVAALGLVQLSLVRRVRKQEAASR